MVSTGALQSGHVSALGNTTLKSGAGWLHSVCIITKGATGNTLTLYDNTAASGTILAVIDTTAQVQTLLYDLIFNTGLTAALAAGTAADVTITFL
jgi:hypothetical protein